MSFVLLSAACSSSPSAPSAGSDTETSGELAFLGVPIGGILNRDIFYGALVDDELATPDVFVDYQCLGKTRDGHRGTDILLPDFRAMDSGVAVLAAAPGIVIDTQDGFFDRDITLDSTRSGNGVALEHANGFVSVYLHLRQNSVAVEVGQTVAAGDTLGLVGSSGNSNWPHLHFEIRTEGLGSSEDPWHGPCGGEVSLWNDQIPYQNQFRLVDAGLTSVLATDRTALLERPVTVDSVSAGTDHLTFWMILHNPRRISAQFDVVGPDGATALSQNFMLQPSFSLYFTIVSFPVAGVLTEPGVWRIRFTAGAAITTELDFTLVADDTGAAARAADTIGRTKPASELIQVGGWEAVDGPPVGRNPLP